MALPSLSNIRWFSQLFVTNEPDPYIQRDRIRIMERDIGLPVRAFYIGWLFYFLFFAFGGLADSGQFSLEAVLTVQKIFIVYFLWNVGIALLLLGMHRIPLRVLQFAVFTIALADAVFLAALTLIEDGFDSLLYWLFLGLIVRNAVSFPRGDLQILLNLAATLCYVLAGSLDLTILRLDERLAEAEHGTEPFVIRVAMLLLMTACFYGLQVLFDKQRQAEEEAREFAIRQEQLRSTGRLAAEIAHQLKNPLGIINNAGFTLQHALKQADPPVLQQIQIIRDEIQRSDRILTELMGYAQLVEGQVERVNVNEELDHAIDTVFPPGTAHQIQIRKDYASNLPPLLVQRKHLEEIFVNLLKNAEEAMHGEGIVAITTRYAENYSVKVIFSDNGPGIAPEITDQIFEAYFTTKEAGTGLGMSIIKHNIEMYGGTIEVKSELGKGTRFVLLFPGRTLLRLRK